MNQAQIDPKEDEEISFITFMIIEAIDWLNEKLVDARPDEKVHLNAMLERLTVRKVRQIIICQIVIDSDIFLGNINH
jgi:hypothetical protein